MACTGARNRPLPSLAVQPKPTPTGFTPRSYDQLCASAQLKIEAFLKEGKDGNRNV